MQLLRQENGFHSRPVKVAGFFASALPEQVRCRQTTVYRQSVRKTPGKSVPIEVAGPSQTPGLYFPMQILELFDN